MTLRGLVKFSIQESDYALPEAPKPWADAENDVLGSGSRKIFWLKAGIFFSRIVSTPYRSVSSGKAPVTSMSFLDWPVEDSDFRRFNERKKNIALHIICQFQRGFPDIIYDLLWGSPTINARVWRLGSKRYVRLYGGLVRHTTMTEPGLAVALAHETGHHLGGSPRDPFLPWITWQGQADYWAATTGMPKIFGTNSRSMTLRGARQILQLHKALKHQSDDYETDLSADCRYKILRAGAFGLPLPACAEVAYAAIYNAKTL